ncbi:MAG: hypothetical protein ACE144_00010 [Thermodesulfobacteriota bacterium]
MGTNVKAPVGFRQCKNELRRHKPRVLDKNILKSHVEEKYTLS